MTACYSAVVESRRIFRKLKAYVTYRFAATIQIVTVLTAIIFISDCSVNSLYIVLLALFNDLTMLPIAYDYQVARYQPIMNASLYTHRYFTYSLYSSYLKTVLSLRILKLERCCWCRLFWA